MDEHRLLSPEKIYLDLNLAGVGSRFVAYLIDIVFIALIDLAILAALALAGNAFHARGGTAATGRVSGYLLLAVIVLFLGAVYWGYFVFFETIRSGRTPGKGFLKIRVVQESGAPVTFGKILIRNILRMVDALPTQYIVGIVAILLSRKNQRLGDMAAGTIVVRDNVAAAPPTLDLAAIEQPWSPAARLRLPAISEADYAVLRAFLLRRQTLRPETSRDLEGKLVLFFGQKLGLDPAVATDPALFLEQVAALFQRRDSEQF